MERLINLISSSFDTLCKLINSISISYCSVCEFIFPLINDLVGIKSYFNLAFTSFFEFLTFVKSIRIFSPNRKLFLVLRRNVLYIF